MVIGPGSPLLRRCIQRVLRGNGDYSPATEDTVQKRHDADNEIQYAVEKMLEGIDTESREATECVQSNNPLSRTHAVVEFPDLETVGPWGSNNVANQGMGNRRGGLFRDQRGSLSGVLLCVAEM